MIADLTIEHRLPTSYRARALGGIFDVPERDTETLSWRFPVPIEERDWRIGLIAGPSGSGKSVLLRHLFGEPEVLDWTADTVLDDFAPELGIEAITAACSAVGFNTIPAWMRPYSVLSNGEQFRVTLARLLAQAGQGGTVLVDEFSSVVDRQVAKVGAHAVAKYVRSLPSARLVAASCHYDVVPWLQPDWIIEPHRGTFAWRRLRRRPRLNVDVAAVPYAAWGTFAPFHYLTASLNPAARCYVLHVEDTPAAFAAIMYRPHPKTRTVWGFSRVVTLPDWQGLGLVFVLMDTVASAYRALGRRVHTYPAHPAFVRACDRSSHWAMLRRPGYAGTSGAILGPRTTMRTWRQASRPNAVFAYVGPIMGEDEARALLAPHLHEGAA